MLGSGGGAPRAQLFTPPEPRRSAKPRQNFNTLKSYSGYYFDFGAGREGGRGASCRPQTEEWACGGPGLCGRGFTSHDVQMTFREIMKAIAAINGKY